MGAETLNPRQINVKTFDLAIQEWVKLDPLIDPTHERFPEYQELSTKAKALWERLKLNLGIPNGLEEIDKQIGPLNEMYETALQIRGEMAVSNIRKDLHIPAGGSFEGEVERRVDAALSSLSSRDAGIIERGELMKMLYGLNVNPADLREGSVPENFYYWPKSGIINFDKVSAAEKMIQELRRASSGEPKFADIADMLETGINRIKAIEPGRAEAYAMHTGHYERMAMDTRPLRIVGAVGAGLIAIFGLGQYLYKSATSEEGKGPGFSLLIPMWAAVALACVNPKIFFQTGTEKVVEMVAHVGRPAVREVIADGFDDPEALAELQELRREKPTAFKELSKLDSLNLAQVEALTGSTDSVLTKTLSGMTDDVRPAALRMFGKDKMDESEIELTGELMKAVG